MNVDLSTNTIAVLVSGIYCGENNVDPMAIPTSVWISIAEKLEYFLPSWDYEVISFEDWVRTCLLIMPKVMIDEDDLKEMQETTLYWEYPNGNVILVVSMNIEPINR